MTDTYMKIGFIGAGNMGEAFIGAIIKSDIFPASMIYASDIRKERLELLRDVYGIYTTNDNIKLFSKCDVVILAIKPQQINQVLCKITEEKSYKISRRKLIISIAAGFSIKKIEDLLYPLLDERSKINLPIIRVMPNTPALVLEGMSGICFNQYVAQEDVKTARKILEATGKVLEFEEKDLDAVTALSGSGPAYVFYFIESMIQGGIEVGLDHDTASVLTLATVKGAAALLDELKESPELLRRKVTSPGGTTEAALKVLDNNRFKQNIIKAISAAAKRSKELGR